MFRDAEEAVRSTSGKARSLHMSLTALTTEGENLIAELQDTIAMAEEEEEDIKEVQTYFSAYLYTKIDTYIRIDIVIHI